MGGFISRNPDRQGPPVSAPRPARARTAAAGALDPRNAFIMQTLLRDVITSGTGVRALSLKRKDIAGKTGTTNDNIDAWFCGFNTSEVGIAWIGFDQPKTLGANETGSNAALPMWISYMEKALKGVPEEVRDAPPGVVSLRVDPDTGLRDDSSKFSDWFMAEFTPRMGQDALAPALMRGSAPARSVRDQLF